MLLQLVKPSVGTQTGFFGSEGYLLLFAFIYGVLFNASEILCACWLELHLEYEEGYTYQCSYLRWGYLLFFIWTSWLFWQSNAPPCLLCLKLSILVRWPVLVWWPCIGEGILRCSFYLSLNVLANSPKYSSSQCSLLHLYHYFVPLFYCIGSLSLDVYKYVHDCSVALEICVDAILTTHVLYAFV